MTISNVQAAVTLPGNGSATTFAFGFEIPFQDDGVTPAILVAIKVGSVTTILAPNLYSVTGIGLPGGGTVTYPLTGSPLPTGSSLFIARNKAITQPSAFVNLNFVPHSVETALDILVLEMQQIQQEVSQLITGTANIPPVGLFGFVDPTGLLPSDAGFQAAATSGSDYFVPAGNYKITQNIASSIGSAYFTQGSVLNIAGGLTINLNGVVAGWYQIFNITGGPLASTVTIGKPGIGFAEWWGASPTNAAVDSGPAIQACLNTAKITQLRGLPYYIGNPSMAVGSYCLKIQTPGRVLQGFGPTQFANGNLTQLIIQSPTASGILVGFNTDPGGPGLWLEGVRVKDLTIARNVGTYPLANPPTGSANSPTGLRLQWASLCYIEHVYSIEHTFGFATYGTVVCHYVDCRALRYTAGTTPSNDFWAAFFQDNSAVTGLNSGNASLYYQNCGAFSNVGAGGPTFINNVGIESASGFTDTFIDKLETGQTMYGIYMTGRQHTAADYQTEDLIITNCVLDSPTIAAIFILNSGPDTAVQISGCYMAPATGAGGSCGILMSQVFGSVGITGNQTISAAGNTSIGLSLSNCSGVTSINNIYTDISLPVAVLTCSNIRVRDTINAVIVAPPVCAVAFDTVQRGTIECQVYASLPIAIATGVKLIGACNFIEVNCTGIDPLHITGGSANKLLANGTQITTTGLFNGGGAGSNCLASGIMT